MLFIPEFIQSLIVAVMLIVPVSIIYQRAGFNPMWAAMLFVPIFGVFLVVLHLALFPWHKRAKQSGAL
jgi:hypothetical protein